MYIALDLETKGLIRNGKIPEIICVSVASDKGKWCLPWDKPTKELVTGLARENVFVFHNASFDKAVLLGYGIDVLSYEDTQLMSYVWQPNSMTHSLEGWGNTLKHPKLPKPWDGDYPLEWSDELREYCLNDSVLTLKLFHHLREKLESDPQALNFYNTIELPFVEVIQELERTGMCVDGVEMEKMLDELQEKTIQIKDGLVKDVGLCPIATLKYKKPHPDKVEPEWQLLGEKEGNWEYLRYGEFNPNSSHHKAYVLRKVAGWEPEEITPSGEPKVTIDVLEKIDHPIAESFVEYGKMNKIITSFLLPFQEHMDENSVLRGNFNQTVTITGRLSSSNPNLQNLPARGELGKQLRNIVKAPTEDYVMFNGDLSNIEARMLAWMLYEFQEEESLADIFIQGKDFHSSNAEAWGVDRMSAKTLLFAILYGASAHRIAKTLKKPVKEAQALIDRLNESLPAVQRMKEMIWEFTRNNNGVMHTLVGHRLVYPEINSKNKGARGRAERQLFNAFIQGSSGDVLKYLTLKSMPIISKHGGSLAASVHDELLGYVPRDNAQMLCQELTQLFSECELIAPVPIEAEFKYGERWGSLKN